MASDRAPCGHGMGADRGGSVGERCAHCEVERLRTVLRSLISSGGTSATIKALAMNTLEPGSGDAWLHKGKDR